MFPDSNYNITYIGTPGGFEQKSNLNSKWRVPDHILDFQNTDLTLRDKTDFVAITREYKDEVLYTHIIMYKYAMSLQKDRLGTFYGVCLSLKDCILQAGSESALMQVLEARCTEIYTSCIEPKNGTNTFFNSLANVSFTFDVSPLAQRIIPIPETLLTEARNYTNHDNKVFLNEKYETIIEIMSDPAFASYKTVYVSPHSKITQTVRISKKIKSDIISAYKLKKQKSLNTFPQDVGNSYENTSENIQNMTNNTSSWEAKLEALEKRVKSLETNSGTSQQVKNTHTPVVQYNTGIDPRDIKSIMDDTFERIKHLLPEYIQDAVKKQGGITSTKGSFWNFFAKKQPFKNETLQKTEIEGIIRTILDEMKPTWIEHFASTELEQKLKDFLQSQVQETVQKHIDNTIPKRSWLSSWLFGGNSSSLTPEATTESVEEKLAKENKITEIVQKMIEDMKKELTEKMDSFLQKMQADFKNLLQTPSTSQEEGADEGDLQATIRNIDEKLSTVTVELSNKKLSIEKLKVISNELTGIEKLFKPFTQNKPTNYYHFIALQHYCTERLSHARNRWKYKSAIVSLFVLSISFVAYHFYTLPLKQDKSNGKSVVTIPPKVPKVDSTKIKDSLKAKDCEWLLSANTSHTCTYIGTYYEDKPMKEFIQTICKNKKFIKYCACEEGIVKNSMLLNKNDLNKEDNLNPIIKKGKSGITFRLKKISDNDDVLTTISDEHFED